VNTLYGNELTWDLNAFVLSRSSRRDGRLKCSSRNKTRGSASRRRCRDAYPVTNGEFLTGG